MRPVTGTWGAPVLPSGRDDFRGTQKPVIRPVDDLSGFVSGRIRFTEMEPASEVPQVYNQAAGPMVHRYAAGMRADMVAYRWIVAQYCESAIEPGDDRAAGLEFAVLVIANRFSAHPDFKPEWRLP